MGARERVKLLSNAKGLDVHVVTIDARMTARDEKYQLGGMRNNFNN